VTVSEFLIEAYVSRFPTSGFMPRSEDVSHAAEELTREGRRVSLMQTIFVPEYETRFYLFQAQSDEAVLEAARRAGLRFDRVVEASSDWPVSPPNPALGGQ
jgi:hypothetical protein